MNRIFLIEKGRFVVLRDGKGAGVGFNSKEEFYRYCPWEEFAVMIDDIEYMDYEPHRNLFLRQLKNKKIEQLEPKEVSEYEALLDATPEIFKRVTDPFYDVYIDQAKEIKKNMIERALARAIDKIVPIPKALAIVIGALEPDEDVLRKKKVIGAKVKQADALHKMVEETQTIDDVIAVDEKQLLDEN